jgi:hypothetical protein
MRVSPAAATAAAAEIKGALLMGDLALASSLWDLGRRDTGLRNTVYSCDALFWGLTHGVAFDQEGLAHILGMGPRDAPALLKMFLEGVQPTVDPRIYDSCSTRGIALVALQHMDWKGDRASPAPELVRLAERTCDVPALVWLAARSVRYDVDTALAHATGFEAYHVLATMNGRRIDMLFVQAFKNNVAADDTQLADMMRGFCDTFVERATLCKAALREGLYEWLIEREAFVTARLLHDWMARGHPRFFLDLNKLLQADEAARNRRATAQQRQLGRGSAEDNWLDLLAESE